MRALIGATRNRRVGVIGTVGTIGSGAYQRAVAATEAPVELTCAACPGFVEFVERGETTGDQVTCSPSGCSRPCRDAGVDALLLGCTHYPYLARTISDVMGRDVVLVSSADETAFEVRDRARRDASSHARGTRARGTHRFLSSGDVAVVRGDRPAAPRSRARSRRGAVMGLT